MLTSSYCNPISNFQAHGIKTIGLYQYILGIDLAGTVIITRLKPDGSELLFTRMPVGTDIATYWASPDSYNYYYIYQL